MNIEKLALVAGEGTLPLEILEALKQKYSVLPKVYLLAENTAPYVQAGIEIQHIKNPMAIAMILTKMRLTGVRHLMMAGAVPKKSIYAKEKLDEGAQKILSDVRDRNDHSLLAGVVKYVEKFGIQVVSYEEIIPELLADEGHIAGPFHTSTEEEDCLYGLRILRQLLPMSFGQSLVISNRAVVAVEAMEGTDRMIRRAGELQSRGILIKGMRKDQDRRYDLPVVGPQTLEAMAAAGLSALFVEAGSVLLLEKSRFLSEAERLHISVTGVSSCQFS